MKVLLPWKERGTIGIPITIKYQIAFSYHLDLQGPSIAIDTACSSSGTALHLACESLHRGECQAAIVGGINLILHPGRLVQYSQMQMLASSSTCKPFAAGADGTLLGEGVGALLLKPLRQAEADGDSIYGIVKKTAIDFGGKTNGFTVPNPRAQADAIGRALEQAKIDARTIGYVEAHGTGTALGDPIEIRGLTMAFREKTGKDRSGATQYCALGSVKSNIGHTESGAAIAGIIKVLLQMKYKTLVPSLHAAEQNPEITFEKNPIFHPAKYGGMERTDPVGRRTIYCLSPSCGCELFWGGGSQFSCHFGRTHGNGCCPKNFISPWRDCNRSPLCQKRGEAARICWQITFSFYPSKLQCMSCPGHLEAEKLPANSYSSRYRESTKIDLHDLAHTLQIGREPMPYRVAFLVANLTELVTKLSQFIEPEKQNIEGCFRGNTREGKATVQWFRDEDIQGVVARWIEKRESQKLAKLWTQGLDLDWSLLYGKAKPKKN